MRITYYFSLAFSLFVQTPEAEALLTLTNGLAMSKGHGAVDVAQRHHHVHVYIRGEGEFTLELIRLADGELMGSSKGEGRDSFRYSKSELNGGAYMVRVIFEGKPVEVCFWVGE